MNNAAYQWSNLLSMLRGDLKKTGALAVLVAVLLVMVGKQFLGGARSHPSAAGAAVASSANPSAAGNSPVALLQRLAAVSEALQKWSDAPISPVSRNLFSVRMEYFPMDGSRTVQSGPAEEGFWSKLEKSLALRTDERIRHENLVASFKVEAEKLKLQSILQNGPEPKAMIDGQLVGEGSVVANFRVLKIEARRVIVEREGIMLAIQMK